MYYFSKLSLVNLYLQWSKEESAPDLIRIHPYLIPITICIGILIITLAFLIYTSVREYRIKKRNNLEARLSYLEKQVGK